MDTTTRPCGAARARFVSAAEVEQMAECRAADLLSDATDAAVDALENFSTDLSSIERLHGEAETHGWDRGTLFIEAVLAAMERSFPSVQFKFGPKDAA